jgi:hypothetical protein
MTIIIIRWPEKSLDHFFHPFLKRTLVGSQQAGLSSWLPDMLQAPNSHSGSFHSKKQAHTPSPIDELARIFNTALVATRSEAHRDFSVEIVEAIQSPPFKAILSAVRQHSLLEGITEKQAAEQIIGAFRKLDQIWADYVFQEGLERVRGRSG